MSLLRTCGPGQKAWLGVKPTNRSAQCHSVAYECVAHIAKIAPRRNVGSDISLRNNWSVGGTAQTDHGLLGYVDKYRLSIILSDKAESIIESVDGD